VLKTTFQNRLLPFALLAISQSIYAQQTPNAGSQLQQIPVAPIQQKVAPAINVEPNKSPSSSVADQTKIIVQRLQITGSKAYSEVELIAIAGFTPNSELSLAELRSMAAKITDHYRRNGYFVAQTYVLAQGVKDGVVTLSVLEGQYDKITLNNQSNLSSSLANSLLSGLTSGNAVTNEALENRLLLLSDLPGVNVKSTLTPGASVGSSDLIVDVTPGQRITGSVDADNHGSRYTGKNRLGGILNINEPFGLGDVITLRALTSTTGLEYGRFSYQAQVGKAKVGVAYANMNYTLGREFDSLHANGTAKVTSLYASYPLIRSRTTNLYALIYFDDKTLQDKVNASSTVTDKKARAWMTSLNGDHRDNLGGGGLSNYSFTWTHGNLHLKSEAALAIDAITLRSNGSYDKLALNVGRLQSLTGPFSFYGAIKGQFASKNLDSSEKMELGGADAVRAYPEGEAYADTGYVLNLEARLLLPKFSEYLPGKTLLLGFMDTGTVSLNKNPWSTGENRRTLSGVGIGLNWVNNNDFVVKAYMAHKLGNAVATSAPDADNRFWIQAVKYY